MKTIYEDIKKEDLDEVNIGIKYQLADRFVSNLKTVETGGQDSYKYGSLFKNYFTLLEKIIIEWYEMKLEKGDRK